MGAQEGSTSGSGSGYTYYGGYRGHGKNSDAQSYAGSAGGGSGYIGNSNLTNKAMYCYNCPTSDDVSTKTINTTCTSETPTTNCSKQGNGYARITIMSCSN